jgi:hypothetical protein
MTAPYGVLSAVGYPDYSSAGTSKYIPQVWSTKMLEKFYDATVVAQIANTNWSGEIKGMGDKVFIRTRGDTVVKPYKKGQTLTYQDVESPDVELVIDKADYWAFKIDDVDKYQSDLKLMDEWASDATEKEKIYVDSMILTDSAVYAGAHASNMGTTAGRISSAYNMGTSGAPIALTVSNIIRYLVFMGAIMDEQNIPETERWCVIPALVAALLKTSDIKDAHMMGDEKSVLRSGRIGRVDRLTLYGSNLLKTATDATGDLCFYVLFGHPVALTFASQYVDTKYIPNPETTFGKLMAGLHVFGYKVLKTEGLGVLYCTVKW